jgi:hypothetical protein
VSSPEEARGLHNLGTTAWARGDIVRGCGLFADAARVSDRFGSLRMAMASRAVHCATLHPTGCWDEALAIADGLIAAIERAGASYFEYHVRNARSRIGVARGDNDQLVLAEALRGVEVARSAKDRQALIPTLGNAALVSAALGRADVARQLAQELASMLADASTINVHRSVEAAWIARQTGIEREVRDIALTTPEGYAWREAVLAVLDEDYERAAGVFASVGHVDEGYARLRAGARHLAEGRKVEAEDELKRSLALHRRLSARRYVSEAEELLARAGLEVSA